MSDNINIENIENKEWVESIDYVFKTEGEERVREIISLLQIRAQEYGIIYYCPGNTPYINTIPA